MNNRIFELAKEADLIEWDILPSDARTPDHESVVKARKFAELLIRECLFIIDDERKPDMVNRTELWHQIVEHFGVK